MYHVPNNVECRHYQKVGGGKATCPRTRTVHPGQCFISDNTRRLKDFFNYLYIILLFLRTDYEMMLSVHPHQIGILRKYG